SWLKVVDARQVADLSANVMPGVAHLVALPLDEVVPEPTTWMWSEPVPGEPARNLIPTRSLTLLAGREGCGKSTFTAWLIARVTRGELPGALYGTARNVLLVAVEDSWSMTIAPRLIAAGTDMGRVFRVAAQITPGELGIVTLPADQGDLERLIV